ncbi:MAG: hypothetical protein ACI4QZ_02395 [Eubacteriales bacterium]
MKYKIRRKAKKEIKLYNVLFPFWALLLFPQAWLIVLLGNFIIDSLVFLLIISVLKIEDKKQWYKKYILKIYGFGLLADIQGATYMFLMISAFHIGNMGDELYLTVPALIISAALIFVFNYFITFKKIDRKTKRISALILAVVTAPYTFLIPSGLLY